MIKNRKNFRYYAYYSLLFVLVSLAVFSYFYLNHKTFISHGDGIRQHYKVLIYISSYFKQIFSDLFTKHKLIIPQWDFYLGEGADILGNLHFYGISDPFFFFVYLVPEKYIYAYYDFIVVFKMYLAGFFFLML